VLSRKFAKFGKYFLACVFCRDGDDGRVANAIIKQDGGWWIGWGEEIPGVNSQGETRLELLKNLRSALKEALEFNREDALSHRQKQLPPQLPVERAELDRLADVVAGDFFGGGEVRNRARHFQNAVVSAGTQIVFRHRVLEHFTRRLVEFASGF
jgi:predicted RNase H-like HicB family nuclease